MASKPYGQGSKGRTRSQPVSRTIQAANQTRCNVTKTMLPEKEVTTPANLFSKL